MNSELINAIKQIAIEKGFDEDKILDALKFSLVSACKKQLGLANNITVEINKETGKVRAVAHKQVVNEVEDDKLEISLEHAKSINPNYNLDEVVEIEVTPQNFGRISAQTAKQVVTQQFMELERDNVFQNYLMKKDTIIIGTISNIGPEGNLTVKLSDTEVKLPVKEQIPGESFNIHDKVKLYIVDVKRHNKGVSLFVSRNHVNFIRCLFEMEVHEIRVGVVKIKDITREPGLRTKISLESLDKNVEAIGSCIGENNSRINLILNEIGNEKIDLVNWSDDITKYIASALSPARINSVTMLDSKKALVVVEDDQVSRAIGKNGQNIRLAARLVGCYLDVKTRSQIEAENT